MAPGVQEGATGAQEHYLSSGSDLSLNLKACTPQCDLRGWCCQLNVCTQVSTYNFYTAADDGAPLKLHMFGRNIMEDSHFDGERATRRGEARLTGVSWYDATDLKAYHDTRW